MRDASYACAFALMVWVLLIIGHAPLSLMVFFWVVVLAAIGVVYLRFREVREDRRQRDEAEAQARLLRSKQEYEKAQDVLHAELVSVCSQSVRMLELAAIQLRDAESFLDSAEDEFKEGAFSPFWDVIQKAIVCLGRFDEKVVSLENDISRYPELARRLQTTPPPFPVALDSIHALKVSVSTASRFKEVVRKAQCNFQFATIYEQRKTNEILLAGFQNLAEAIEGIGARIEASLSELAQRIEDLSDTQERSADKLYQGIKNLNSTIDTAASADAARQERALGMLDNIQRRRKPLIPTPGGRSY